jgi:hypothetical protein
MVALVDGYGSWSCCVRGKRKKGEEGRREKRTERKGRRRKEERREEEPLDVSFTRGSL